MNPTDHTYNNLSNINNMKDLQAEIDRVKGRLSVQKKELEIRWKEVPAHAVQKATSNILPAVLTKGTILKSFSFLKGIGALVSLILSFRRKRGLFGYLGFAFRKILIMILLKTFTNWRRNRKSLNVRM